MESFYEKQYYRYIYIHSFLSVSGIASFFKWLGNMVNICNDKMGGPYKKCKDAITSAKKKCMYVISAISTGILFAIIIEMERKKKFGFIIDILK